MWPKSSRRCGQEKRPEIPSLSSRLKGEGGRRVRDVRSEAYLISIRPHPCSIAIISVCYKREAAQPRSNRGRGAGPGLRLGEVPYRLYPLIGVVDGVERLGPLGVTRVPNGFD